MSFSLLRQQLIQQRIALSIAEQAQAEQAILHKLVALTTFKHAKKIACYLSIRGEVPTQKIINTIWQQKKQCYLPIMQSDKTLKFAEYKPTSTLIENQVKIFEPKLSETYIIPKELDLVLVPLVGFESTKRIRLGYGAGYYDFSFSFLLKKSANKPYLVGLGYDFQQCSDLVQKEWDVPMHQIITPTKIY